MGTHKNKNHLSLTILSLIIGAVVCTPTFAAVINVTHDHFELETSINWVDAEFNPSSEPDGTVNNQFTSGSVFGDSISQTEITDSSNMGSVRAGIEEYNSGADSTVYVYSFFDDDCESCHLGSGLSKAIWNLEFDVVGSDGSLNIDGFMWNTTDIKNEVSILDMTTNTTTVLNSSGDISLMDGHSYQVSVVSEQLWGLDYETGPHLKFASAAISVPEPSTWAILLACLGLLRIRSIKRTH